MIPPIEEVLKMKDEEKSTCPNWKGECDSDLGAACPAGATCPARGGADAMREKKILVGEFATMPANIVEDLSRCIQEFGRVGESPETQPERVVELEAELEKERRKVATLQESFRRKDDRVLELERTVNVLERALLIPAWQMANGHEPNAQRFVRGWKIRSEAGLIGVGVSEQCQRCGGMGYDCNCKPSLFPDDSAPGMVVSSKEGER